MGSTWEIIVRLHGLYSCFLSTSVLAATLLLLSHGLSTTINKIKLLLISSGPILAALAVTLSFLLQPISDADYNDVQHVAGNIHTFVTIAVTSFSLLVTTTCLGLKHKIEVDNPNFKDDEAPLKLCPVVTGQQYVDDNIPSYTPQMFRHTLLLLLCCCSMFSSLTLAITRVTGQWSSTTSFPGAYKVILFLDTFLSSGYGLLLLAVFALDCKVILLPLSTLVRKIVECIKGSKGDFKAWNMFIYMDTGLSIHTRM